MAVRDERFRSGNHARVFVTGDGTRALLGEALLGPLGKGMNFRANTRTGAQYQHIIGDEEPADINHTKHEYPINLSVLMLRTDRPTDIVNAGRIEIEIYDKFTNALVCKAEQCELVDGNLNVPANQVVVRELSLLALRIT